MEKKVSKPKPKNIAKFSSAKNQQLDNLLSVEE